MSRYHIRFATLNDADGIMNFIREHWRSNHLLALNKSFFLYEYQDGEQLNFALAIDQETNQIVGLCGFIKNSKKLEGSDVWGSLWKVIKTENPMLGIQILEFIPEQTACRSFSSLGIAKKTLPIYDFLRFKTNKLHHYYRLNDQVHEYQVAVVADRQILPISEETQFALNRLETVSEINPIIFEQKERYPYKDRWYIQKRYFEHPVYQYQLLGFGSGTDSAVVVLRMVQHQNVKILRIVDFLGNHNTLANIGLALDQLMKSEHCEYMDFFNFGIPPEMMQRAGFKLRDENDQNVIPNYFEPFVQTNAELYFFNDRNSEYFSIFKADGDQDRPNLLS